LPDASPFASTNLDVCESRMRHLAANIIWTHKVHEKQADIYSGKYRYITNWDIVLTAISGCGVFSSVFFDCYIMKISSFIFIAVTLYVTIFSKITDYSRLSAEQVYSASDFLEIREAAFNVLAKIHFKEYSTAQACDDINYILSEYSRTCRSAPRTMPAAVACAERALKNDGDSSYTEDEIDELLPQYLRRNRR